VKPRTLLVLAVLVAALGSFIWFWERRQPSSEERAERGKKLVALEVDEVQSVTIAAAGRPTVRVERVPETTPTAWRLTEPLQAAADRWAVERLIESFDGLEKQRTLEDPDRKSLGLEEPRATITFERTAGTDAVVVEIGAKLPAAAAMAAAVRGAATAAVVPDAIYADLTKEPGEWRSREMFTAQRDAIERLGLPGGVLLARRGESFWLEAPLADRADRDLVNTLLSDITSLRAAEFLDTPPTDAMGLGQVLEVVLKDQEAPFRLELGSPAPGGAAGAERRYARIASQLFTTESKIGESTARPAAEWRSPAWSSFEVFRIDAARFEGPLAKSEEPIALARAEGNWKRGAVTVTFTTVSDLLYAVSGAKSTTLLSKADAAARGADLSTPTLTVTLTASDDTEEVLTLYPPLADGSVPAMASGRDTVLLLPPAALAEIDAKLEAVKKAEPEAAAAATGDA
jgi:hypothetical protein